jgi:hypothetical protein
VDLVTATGFAAGGVTLLTTVVTTARWAMRRRSKLLVTVAMGWFTRPGYDYKEPRVSVRALNKRRPTTITDWGFEPQFPGAEAPEPDIRGSGMSLPHRVDEGDIFLVTVGSGGFVRGQLDLYHPLIAWVTTADGRIHRSKIYTPGPGDQKHWGRQSTS